MMEAEQTLCDILGNLLVYCLADENAHTSLSDLEADINKQPVPDWCIMWPNNGRRKLCYLRRSEDIMESINMEITTIDYTGY